MIEENEKIKRQTKLVEFWKYVEKQGLHLKGQE